MANNVPAGRRRFASGGIAVAIACWGLVLVVPTASAAPIHVDCDSGGNLQNKINSAPGGGTILVKGTCEGLFSIGFKSLTIKGNRTATLDGQSVDTTLSVNATGKTVTLVDLVITGGSATDQGGGIFVDDGTLHLVRTTVRGNVVDASANSYGGGISILGSGELTLTSSIVNGNWAITEPASGYANAYGGGIYATVPVTLDHSTVSGNVARAVSVDQYAYSYGGGVEVGGLELTGSTVSGNTSKAVSQGAEAYAYGGGVDANNAVTASGTTISNNKSLVRSDTSYAYATGGGMNVNAGPTILSGTSVSQNLASAVGADHTFGDGGGIFQTGDLTLEHSSVNGNHLTASSSADEAGTYGGGVEVYNGNLVLKRSTVGRNLASALAPTDRATAQGAGVLGRESVSATNSTIASNFAQAASGGSGFTGTADGGGVSGKSVTLVAATVGDNEAEASGDVVVETGGGLSATTGLVTEASILAANDAASGPDCFASTTTHGYNLVQQTAGCLVSPKPSDVIGQPAQLGTLKSNGGPTQTMAIPATSEAFNTIPPARCTVPFDQRGVARPQGTRCDIGAYERRVP
jgi:hypothetical protein